MHPFTATVWFELPVLVRFHWLTDLGVLGSLAAWLYLHRRRAGTPLSWPQRSLLLVLLGALLFARWMTGQSFSGAFDPPVLPHLFRVSDLPDIIDFEAPSSTSITVPNIRTIQQRNVLMLFPTTRIEWTLPDTVRAISMEYGFDPEAYERGTTNGAGLTVELVGPTSTRSLFYRLLDPQRVVSDRHRQHTNILLPPFEPGAKLVLRSDPGPYNDAAWDWLYLSHLRFHGGPTLAARQFPGFTPLPDRAKGDNSVIVLSPQGVRCLAFPAPSVLTFQLRGSERHLDFDYGFLPTAYSNGGHTNGAIFRVELKSHDGSVRRLFEHYPKPVEHAADRELQHARVALPAVQAGDLLLLSILGGDHDDCGWDHTFVSRFILE